MSKHVFTAEKNEFGAESLKTFLNKIPVVTFFIAFIRYIIDTLTKLVRFGKHLAMRFFIQEKMIVLVSWPKVGLISEHFLKK